MTDVRFAARSFMRSPGFTVVATMTLALGIGANAAVVGLVDRLMAPPPFDSPDDVVLVWSTIGDRPERHRVSAPEAAAIQARIPGFSSVAFMDRVADAALLTGTEPGARHVRVARVTADLFDVLGVEPALGRAWSGDEVAAAAGVEGQRNPTAVVISDAAWRNIFAADPGVVGRDVLLDGATATVIGVMPSGLRVPMPPDVGIATDADVWTPLRAPLDAFGRADGRLVDEDSDNSGAVLARLRDGASLQRVRADLAQLRDEMRARLPEYDAREAGFVAVGLHEDSTRHLRPLVVVLLAAVVGLLVLMCLNVSTLLLARGTGRDGEISVRIALGAGRGRVGRQLLTEGALLVAIGTAAAAVVAVGIAEAVGTLLPAGALAGGAAAPSVETLALSAALALLTIQAASLGPLFRTLRRGDRLGRAGAQGVRPSSRLREALVVGQVAASVVLLLGAGLLLRSAKALDRIDPGFVAASAMSFGVSLRDPTRHRGPADRARAVREIEEALSEVGGVGAVGTTTHLPLSGRRWVQPYAQPGAPPEEWATNRADFRAATSGYFEALGTRLLEGRAFTAFEDLNEERRVVVVDSLLAARLGGVGSAVGRSIRVPLDGREVLAEIVGVVEHVRHERLDADGREAIYVPYRQEASREVSFVVRAGGGAVEGGAVEGSPVATALSSTVRQAVRRLDPGLALYDLESLERRVDRAIGPTRLGVLVLTAFAALAVLAVGVGLYGVVAIDAVRRRRDYGLRVAVGARPRHLVRRASANAIKTAALGCAAGVALALVVGRVVGSALHSVRVTDPATWAGVLGVVTLVTLLACLGPAVRASRVDPTTALRSE